MEVAEIDRERAQAGAQVGQRHLVPVEAERRDLATFEDAILDRLFREYLDAGKVEPGLRCVYLSPLRSLGYDIERDLAPVALAVKSSHVLLSHPSVPVRRLPELIALDEIGNAQLIGDGSVPSHLQAAARLAEANCPEYALQILEEQGD